MAERKYGAEIVTVDDGGTTVTELKAATALLVGTAPIQEVHATAEERAAYVNKKILIKRRDQIAEYFGPVRDGYTIPAALHQMFDQEGTQGIGTICVVNVFDPDTHVTDGNPDPSVVTNLEIIGTFDAAGQPSGLQHAYACYQSFGWFPKFLLVPGFSTLTGVRTTMQTIANKVRARYFLDAPLGVSAQQVIEARGDGGDFDWQVSSRRAVGCWPYLKFVDLDPNSETAGEKVPLWYSPVLAAIWMRYIVEVGYHHSPSNREIICEEPAQECLYIPGDFTSDVQEMRANGIVTCEERHGKGPHTSGNRSMAWPTDTNMRNFLHVQLIEDVLHEAVLHYLDQWKDRNGNPANIELVEDRINAYGLGKTTGKDPALSGFRFAFDRQQTTTATVAEGHYYWTMKWAPVGVMEWLTVNDWIDTDLLGDPLGLSTADTSTDVA